MFEASLMLQKRKRNVTRFTIRLKADLVQTENKCTNCQDRAEGGREEMFKLDRMPFRKYSVKNSKYRQYNSTGN